MIHTSNAAWMIIPTYFPVVGGAQVQVQQLSQALASQGWSVTVLTRRHSYAHPMGLPSADVRMAGIPVRRLFSRGKGKIGSIVFVLNGLWYLMRHGKRGIYHAHDTGAAGWLAVAARYLLGGRCLIKLRTGTVAYQQSLKSRLVRWQFKALLRSADRIIVVNREMQDYLEQAGIPAERVTRIPNGVDVDRFCPATTEQKALARARLGLEPKKQILLYVGRLEYMKGVDILLRGWKDVNPEQRQTARLLLVGDGPERKSLEQMANSFGISDSVGFTGEQYNVQQYYQAADLFVLPSRTEGLSNSLLEAMASGLPVLVSEVGGAKDIVSEGQSGFFFPSENPQIMAARLEAVLMDPSEWERCGQYARASVVANASMAATVQRTEIIYKQMAESMGQTRAGFASSQGD